MLLVALGAGLLLFFVPIFVLFGILLPGAATITAWDCLADLDCTFALSGLHQMHPRPVHHTGAWAVVMGLLLGGLGVLIAGGIAHALLMFRKLEPPRLAVAAATALLLALDVAAVMALEALL